MRSSFDHGSVLYEHTPFGVWYKTFYPSAVSGAMILDGFNSGLPRMALHSSPQRFLQHRPDFELSFVIFTPDASIAFLHAVSDGLLL